MDRNRAIVCVIIGISAGLLSGLLGVGGGVILIPAMIYILNLPQVQAHGTSLGVILFIALFALVPYTSEGQINWLIALGLAIGGVTGAPVGAVIAHRLTAARLRSFFGVFLLLVGIRMLFDAADTLFIPGESLLPTQVITATGVWYAIIIILIGLITGILSGLLGIGGGIIMIPAMVLLLGIEQQTAQGISLAVIVPVALSGAITHYKHGNIRKDILFLLVIGGIIGAPISGLLTIRLEPVILRGVFGVLLAITGTRMAILKQPQHQT
ncbi:MAG TPA: sulfite exporter TauE/SafE family protein [Armatimonadota bacterium]|nr:sulfite exporter TauE/SafE family protein [Armatimonadota bacterium]